MHSAAKFYRNKKKSNFKKFLELSDQRYRSIKPQLASAFAEHGREYSLPVGLLPPSLPSWAGGGGGLVVRLLFGPRLQLGVTHSEKPSAAIDALGIRPPPPLTSTAYTCP